MASNRQINANQLNSLKSTGPSTDAGKFIVAQNALKHGILSAKVPIDEEEREDFNNFASYLKTSLMPNGALEEALVDRIISTIWRLRRVVHIEGLMLEKSINNAWEESTYQEVFEGNSGQAMAILSRYERTLENSFFRALREFREIKNFDVPVTPSL
jgi:hypothetical protein